MSNEQVQDITGRLGRNPVFYTRNTPKGECPVAKFSVGVKKFVNGERQTVWVNVSAWDKRSEYCQRLQKGDAVQCFGFLHEEEYDNKKGEHVRGWAMNAIYIEFLGRPQPKNEAAPAAIVNNQPALQNVAVSASSEEDDIPF